MKNFVFAALAATAAFAATPAMAQEATPSENFDGFRIGATAGFDNVTGAIDTNDVVYGADVGYDFSVSDRIILGVEATATNVFEDSRTFGAAARAGVAVTDNFMPFIRAGWANYRDVTNIVDRDVDGLTVGGGFELAVTKDFYAKVEYRYSDFEQGVGNHGAILGVGLRF